MNVLLISTYELGHQPFGVASPAAWLKQAGFSVTCLDLAIQPLSAESVKSADVIAFYVPMHTATRIATSFVERVRQVNPCAHLCFYGLYAPVNEFYLRKLGVETILGGEFEAGLLALVKRISQDVTSDSNSAQVEPLISLARQQFLVPDRSELPDLRQYAHITFADGRTRTVGYAEASRGCKHLCRHCPIVPVYQGQFRIVQRDVVLKDIQQQVEAGASHITFGDPDFLNGPGHAFPLVKAVHQLWPHLTYDVTIKVEHLLKHHHELLVLRETGCVLITTAVESVDNTILKILDKRHTREDFIRVVLLLREVGLALNPTFVTFTPWTSLSGYLDLLQMVLELDLVDNVAPVQYGIRLLIPNGSKLMELAQVRELVDEFDEKALYYPWVHSDPMVDQLWQETIDIVKQEQAKNKGRWEIFEEVWRAATRMQQPSVENQLELPKTVHLPGEISVPSLSEPWYCCAEPVEEQLAPIWAEHV